MPEAGPRCAPAVAACAVLSVVLGGAAANASFTGTAHGAQQVGTATLAAPADAAAAPGTCTAGEHDEVAVSWVPTPSEWADGYEVLRATDAAGPYVVVATMAERSATTYVDPALAFDTTYHYTVRATKLSWRSAPSAGVSRTTRTPACS